MKLKCTKWLRNRRAKRLRNRRAKLRKQIVFAWFPVSVSNKQCIWWEDVQRVGYISFLHDHNVYQYTKLKPYQR
jgi:hypothetical protein